MLIGSFPVGADFTIPKLNIMTPCQSLLVVVKTPAEDFDFQGRLQSSPVISVSLQNSENGKRDEIIPFLSLPHLSEISSYNEGSILFTGRETHYPVMLNPVGNINLSNNKFLQVEISRLNYTAPVATIVEVYAIQSSIMNDFVTRYEKLSMPQGLARQTFNTANLEFVYFPNFDSAFDFVRLTHSNGVVQELNKTEIVNKQFRENDITAVMLKNTISGLNSDDTSANVFYGFGFGVVFNLLDVKEIEVARESTASEGSYTFITGNMK